MCFLCMFNLLDFDSQGNVKETKQTDLPKARSNFLYLVCKFNQNFLKEQGLPVPEFFKEQLPLVLEGVEHGMDYEAAKKKIFANCLPQVNKLATLKEKEIVSSLVEASSVNDLEFADKFKEAKNHLQLEYIMTVISGKIFNKIELLGRDLNNNKSKLFKEVVKYNTLVNATENVREQKMNIAAKVVG